MSKTREYIIQNITLETNDLLTFTKDGKYLVVSRNIAENNNLKADELRIKKGGSVGLYLAKNQDNDNFNLFVSGYEITYTVEINGVSRNLTKNENPEYNITKEYKIEGVELNKGDVLVVKVDNEVFNVGIDGNNNNVSMQSQNITVLRTTLTANIYVKLQGGNWLIYVTGYTAPKYEVMINGLNPRELVQSHDNENQWEVKTTLEAGQILSFAYDEATLVATGENTEQNNVEVNLTVKKTGTSTIYLKKVINEWQVWVSFNDVTITLKINDNWKKDGAIFSVEIMGGSALGSKKAMTMVAEKTYQVTLDATTFTTIKFLRINPNDTNVIWNHTGVLNVSGSNKTFTLPMEAWDGSTDTGNWS